MLPALPIVTFLEMEREEEPTSEQFEILRRMAPEQRYRASRELYWTLRRHKKAFLRSVHPGWSEARLDDEVRSIFLHARS